jgi:hypothetical protein
MMGRSSQATVLRPFTLPRSDVLSPPASQHPIYCRRFSFSRTLRLVSTIAASAAACTASRRCRKVVHYGSVSQWVAVCLLCRKLPYQPRELSGRVPGQVLRLLWAHLGHSLIICPKSVE